MSFLVLKGKLDLVIRLVIIEPGGIKCNKKVFIDPDISDHTPVLAEKSEEFRSLCHGESFLSCYRQDFLFLMMNYCNISGHLSSKCRKKGWKMLKYNT